MAVEIFASSKQKINRADQHIAELKELLDTFAKRDFYKVDKTWDEEAKQFVVAARMIGPGPQGTGLMISDVIHNLRDALDHMAFELVIMAGQTPSSQTEFPFADTAEKLRKLILDTDFRHAGSDVIELVVNGIQPFEQGNSDLYGLALLDRLNKHRLLNPVSSVVITVWPNDKHFIKYQTNVLTVEEGQLAEIFRAPEDFDFTFTGDASLLVRFAPQHYFEHKPVLPVLETLSKLVFDTVQAVENICILRGRSLETSQPEEPIN